MNAADAIRASRLVAILRSTETAHIPAVAEALAAAGLTTLEIPLTRPESLAAISATIDRLGDDVHVGAGTVRTVENAARAIDAGATFLLAPGLSVPVVEYANQCAVPMLPGVFTPTEVDTAAQAGAQLVKLFPANSLDPEFVRQLRAPIPEVGVMPTGGVTLATARAWLEAGAVALGVGSPLLGDSLTTGQYDAIPRAARRWLATVEAGQSP